jgi:hypothetical protein
VGSVDHNSPEGLKGDPRRHAGPAVRGFFYQFWRTVNAWIDLDPEELLFVEGAEDFDIVGPNEATPVQVKDDKSSGSLTLTSANALAALRNFWKARRDNPGRTIRFQFITTAEAGTEKSGFDGQKGVEVWNLCRQSPLSACADRIEQIRRSVLNAPSLDRDLKRFLKNAFPEDIKKQVIDPFEWLCEQPPLDGIREIVIGRLLKLGENRGLTARDAEKLADRLCMKVVDAAVVKSPQRLNFIALMEELDQSVNIEIPRDAIRQSSEDSSGVFGRLVSTAIKSDGQNLPAITGAVDIFAAPVPVPNRWPRKELVQHVRAALTQGVAYVYGSAGMGKTTLVLQALDDKEHILWASLRHRPTRDIAEVCRTLMERIFGGRGRPIIVLDDLNPTGDPRILEEDLGRLATAIRNLNGELIIISYRAAGPRLASILGLSSEAQIQVSGFAKEEVCEALMIEGCVEARAKALARVVWLHTSGHPQLVAARVSVLKANNFPKPSLDDVIERPKEIKDAQAEALAVVRSILPENVRDLLYRLSLAIPPLRRSHALRIGAADPPISRTGEAFDQLVGPWLEQPIADHYQMSALVSGAAQQSLAPEEVKKLHGNIATALLAEGTLTPVEFAAVVTHAIAGEAEAQVAIASRAFLTAPKEVKQVLARSLPWVARAGVESGTHLPLSNRATRQFFRLMQWDVAGLSMPNDLQDLAKVMEAEFAPVSGRSIENLPRILYLSKLLLRWDHPIPPDKIVAYMLELWPLSRWAAENDAKLDLGAAIGPMHPGIRRPYLADLFVAALLPRVRTIGDIRILVSSLDALKDDDRRTLLNGFMTDDGELRILFNQPWLSIKKEDTAGFEEYVKILEEALSAGRRWKHRPWMRAVARTQSGVLDEMLHRRDDAERVVTVTATEIGSSPNLDDQLASIAFNHREDGKALEIWQRILPKWKSDKALHDTQPLYAARHAAMAAANLGDWKTAAKLFDQAIRRSKNFGMRPWLVGLQADHGYAIWKSGDRKRAVKIFGEVVAQLEKLPNKPESFAEYAVQKLVGHVLAALAMPDKSLPAPLPGMCSNLSPHEGIKEIPPGPSAYAWYLVYNLAKEAGDSGLTTRYAKKFQGAPFSSLRAIFKLDLLRRRLASQNLKGILELATKIALEMEMGLQRKDAPFAEPDPPGLSAQLTMRSVSTYIRPALWAAILRAKVLGRNVARLVETWRAEVDASQPYIAEEFDRFREFSLMGLHDLEIVLKNDQEPADSRLLAALLLLGRDDTSPLEALYAQAMLIGKAKDYDLLRSSAGESVDQLVRKDWRRFSHTPFLLRNPKLHVETIREACRSKSRGWSSAAEIILTARATVKLSFPESLLVTLRDMAAGVAQSRI